MVHQTTSSNLGVFFTREIQAKLCYNFGKDQGLAREREKKRVTPEFGERQEEKILPPNSGRYSVVLAAVAVRILVSRRKRRSNHNDPQGHEKLLRSEAAIMTHTATRNF
jgi:hypothetical protein